MNSIIITTTNNIEGWNIRDYYSPISANVVIGANIFSDISASFTDFFGGRSGTYEQKLQEMYKEVMDKLISQAENIGANSILGLKVDFGEISGKGNQMFMLSAVGTPVFAMRDENKKKTTSTNNQTINGELVETKIKANKLIQDFTNGSLTYLSLTDQKIAFILKSRLLEFSDLVVTLISNDNPSAEQSEVIGKVSHYFKVIDKNDAIKILYGVLSSESLGKNIGKHIIKLIQQYDLIDYNEVSELFKSNEKEVKKNAIRIIALPKAVYLNSDIDFLKEFKQAISTSFPKISENVTTKGFLSSGKEAWLCKCGKTNGMDTIYCVSCDKDQMGFKSNEIKPDAILRLIGKRLETIEGIREKM